jgi:hypothetical protein
MTVKVIAYTAERKAAGGPRSIEENLKSTGIPCQDGCPCLAAGGVGIASAEFVDCHAEVQISKRLKQCTAGVSVEHFATCTLVNPCQVSN